uniref:Uncharacterized protein n=1 Tax=Rangifer tarandus platyrhynchus TaxID=3082113 RepID=A0ACB0F3T4_RANTA|nr:unnamed protein product [Rangifer tarandus platyrhynchus]
MKESSVLGGSSENQEWMGPAWPEGREQEALVKGVRACHIFQDPWEQALQRQRRQTLGHKEPLDGARPPARRGAGGPGDPDTGTRTRGPLTPVRPDNGRGAADAASALIFPKLKSAARRLRLRPPRFSAV